MYNKLTVLPPACHREVEVGFEKGIMLWEMKNIYIYMDKIFLSFKMYCKLRNSLHHKSFCALNLKPMSLIKSSLEVSSDSYF